MKESIEIFRQERLKIEMLIHEDKPDVKNDEIHEKIKLKLINDRLKLMQIAMIK